MDLSSPAAPRGLSPVGGAAFLALPEPVAEDARSLARRRILRAARQVLAAQGLGVSMEAVAVAAGIGRRTLFRYFDTHESLIAEALNSSLDWYDAQISEVTIADQPLHEWLVVLTSRVHAIHQFAGRALWQLAAADDVDLADAIAKVNQRRRLARRSATEAIAVAAWARAGGMGPCPQVVVDVCALTISSFASHSMIEDFGRDPGSVANSSAAILESLLVTQVAVAVAPVRVPNAASTRKKRS